MASKVRLLLLLIVSILNFHKPCAFAENYEPLSFWLSWMKAPSVTMTIRWISRNDRPSNALEFREKGQDAWQTKSGRHINMPYALPYYIHNIELVGLKPDTAYEFRFSDEGKIRFFKTMPEHLTREIRFVDGGDMYHDDIEFLKEAMRTAAKTDPDFVVAGGDLAYSAPSIGLFNEDVKRWFTFLMTWQETMQAPDGRIIPMIPVIGNHEVIGRYGQTGKEAEFYYAFFVTPRTTTNYVLDFGDYMSLVVLDTGHTRNIDGPQTKWLGAVLMDRQDVPNKFATYHVPAYPSVRKFDTKISSQIRKNWTPIFEAAHLNAAFEHHDHAYKRTFPLTRGEIDQENGVIYLGDGAFGVREARIPSDLTTKWYLEKAMAARHFILVTLSGKTRKYMAINHKGEVIDKFNR